MTAVPVHAVERRARLLRFATSLRRRHAVRAALFGALVAALVMALPAVVATVLVPAMLPRLAALVLAVAVVAGLGHALFARRVADAALLRDDGRGDRDLRGIGDELATWLELERRHTGEQPMPEWLGARVEAEVQALDPAALATVGRRRLGGARWLVPVALLVLLAMLILVFLNPDWPGLLGGRPDAPRPVPPALGAGAGVPTQGSGSQAPQDQQASSQPKPADQPEKPRENPPPAEDQPQPPPPPLEPPPLLQLPQRQLFAVPEFVDDGPTRRMRAHIADAPENGSRPTATPEQGGTTQPAPTPAPPPAVEFERAAERAQSARHVPADEQAIVRRFFDLLREANK